MSVRTITAAHRTTGGGRIKTDHPDGGAELPPYGRFIPATDNLSTASKIGVYTAFFLGGSLRLNNTNYTNNTNNIDYTNNISGNPTL